MHQVKQHLNLDRDVMLAVKYICSTDIGIASMYDLTIYEKLKQYSEDDISACVSRLIFEGKLDGNVETCFGLTEMGRVYLRK